MPISSATMLRPRQEFPTPLFKLVVPLLVAAAIVLAVLALR